MRSTRARIAMGLLFAAATAGGLGAEESTSVSFHNLTGNRVWVHFNDFARRFVQLGFLRIHEATGAGFEQGLRLEPEIPIQCYAPLQDGAGGETADHSFPLASGGGFRFSLDLDRRHTRLDHALRISFVVSSLEWENEYHMTYTVEPLPAAPGAALAETKEPVAAPRFSATFQCDRVQAAQPRIFEADPATPVRRLHRIAPLGPDPRQNLHNPPFLLTSHWLVGVDFATAPPRFTHIGDAKAGNVPDAPAARGAAAPEARAQVATPAPASPQVPREARRSAAASPAGGTPGPARMSISPDRAAVTPVSPGDPRPVDWAAPATPIRAGFQAEERKDGKRPTPPDVWENRLRPAVDDQD